MGSPIINPAVELDIVQPNLHLISHELDENQGNRIEMELLSQLLYVNAYESSFSIDQDDTLGANNLKTDNQFYKSGKYNVFNLFLIQFI